MEGSGPKQPPYMYIVPFTMATSLLLGRAKQALSQGGGRIRTPVIHTYDSTFNGQLDSLALCMLCIYI